MVTKEDEETTTKADGIMIKVGITTIIKEDGTKEEVKALTRAAKASIKVAKASIKEDKVSTPTPTPLPTSVLLDSNI